MKRPIPTLAAYCDLSELPAYWQEQVQKAFSHIQGAAPNDNNTECYLRKEQDSGYTLTVNFFYCEDVPETKELYLDETPKESRELDNLLIKGIQYSLAHIADIY